MYVCKGIINITIACSIYGIRIVARVLQCTCTPMYRCRPTCNCKCHIQGNSRGVGVWITPLEMENPGGSMDIFWNYTIKLMYFASWQVVCQKAINTRSPYESWMREPWNKWLIFSTVGNLKSLRVMCKTSCQWLVCCRFNQYSVHVVNSLSDSWAQKIAWVSIVASKTNVMVSAPTVVLYIWSANAISSQEHWSDGN